MLIHLITCPQGTVDVRAARALVATSTNPDVLTDVMVFESFFEHIESMFGPRRHGAYGAARTVLPDGRLAWIVTTGDMDASGEWIRHLDLLTDLIPGFLAALGVRVTRSSDEGDSVRIFA